MNPGSFCGSCGAVVKPGALYCGSCGSPAAPAPAAALPPAPPTMVGTVGSTPVPPSPFPVPAPPSGLPGFAGYATFGRRVGAYVIDAIPSVLMVVIANALFFSSLVHGSVGGAQVSLILIMFCPLAYLIVLWAMAAKGSSPGNAILGIRVVRDNGAVPGVGLGLGRLLLKGLLIGITFYIGGFSPLWDRTGRRKGWWDSACNTVVLDREAVPAYRAAVGAFGSPAIPVDPSSTSIGEPSIGPARQGFADAADPAPVEPVTIPPAGPGSPVIAGVPEAVDDRPAWDIAPVAPHAVVTGPSAPAHAATWGDRPVDSVGSYPAAVPPGPPPPPPAPLPRHAAPPGPEPVLRADLSSDLSSESSVITSVPGFGSSWVGATAADESLDHTRLRVAPQEPGSGWIAELDDGRTQTLTGKLILGRDPSARPEDGDAIPIEVDDESLSVSKTHLLLEVGPVGVQVTDRHSTNGVVVVTAGVELPCVPGVATPVPDGSTVRFGDRALRVRQR